MAESDAMSGAALPHITEHRFTDAAVAAATLADLLESRFRDAIEYRGQATMVVSGGRSPVALLQALRKRKIDWPRIWLTLADERWVDAASEHSNEYLLRANFLVDSASAIRFIALKTAAASPADALTERSAALAVMPRPFDAVVLGMGEDGHIASLFPNAVGLAAALSPSETPVLAAIDPPNAPHPRLSLTLSTLLGARCIYLLLNGATKHKAYEQAINASPLRLPVAALLQQARTPVQVFFSP